MEGDKPKSLQKRANKTICQKQTKRITNKRAINVYFKNGIIRGKHVSLPE